ncbi:MAG TPA: hypothetical protein PKC21_10370 [Oligoflexia bacterium]|nr:hypothetical protein [Oligoflexia bacterium]HMR25744.1 hypothetical protein [Oligoflexia bacterium]
MRISILIGVMLCTTFWAYAEDLKNCRLYDEKLNMGLKESTSYRPMNFDNNYVIKYEMDSNHVSLDASEKLKAYDIKFIGEESFSTKPWIELEKMDISIKSIQCAEKITLTLWDSRQQSYNKVVFELIQAGPKLHYTIQNTKKTKKRVLEKVSHQCSYLSPVHYTTFFNTPQLNQKKIECEAQVSKLAQKPWKDGNFIFDLVFAEHAKKTMGCELDVHINENVLTARLKKSCNLSKTKAGDVFVSGQIMHHSSGPWVIIEDKSDLDKKEIGGCTDGPLIVNFKNKSIETC